MTGFEAFVRRARYAVVGADPSLAPSFDLYANEARFGLSLVAPDLAALPAGAPILEVGAGILLLSGFLSSLGFRVTALEPLAPAFSHFVAVQRAVRQHFDDVGVRLSLLECPVEELSATAAYQYVFSINAFEHIRDVERGLANAYRSLESGGVLRVHCPNYHFPYEPHFDIPTLFDKRLTGLVFARRIAASKRVPFPRETWDSLNWITVSEVRRVLARVGCARPEFHRLAAFDAVERVFRDEVFRARRSAWLVLALDSARRMGLVRALRQLPPVLSPVLDVRAVKTTGVASPASRLNRRWC